MKQIRAWQTKCYVPFMYTILPIRERWQILVQQCLWYWYWYWILIRMDEDRDIEGTCATSLYSPLRAHKIHAHNSGSHRRKGAERQWEEMATAASLCICVCASEAMHLSRQRSFSHWAMLRTQTPTQARLPRGFQSPRLVWLQQMQLPADVNSFHAAHTRSSAWRTPCTFYRLVHLIQIIYTIPMTDQLTAHQKFRRAYGARILWNNN